MIVANLATYPPRWQSMLKVMAELSPQVDRLNVVLNEYTDIPALLTVYANVVPILPATDQKDVGKFLPSTEGADVVFLVDDDIRYPADYVKSTLASFKDLPQRRIVAGYHGSIYRQPGPHKPALDPEMIAGSRTIFDFGQALDAAIVVDQLASNTLVARPGDLAPFEYMQGSQKFTDVRLARWCFENSILPVCLPRNKSWLKPVAHPETIYRSFTRSNHAHVAKEIWQYAFRVPGRGKSPQVDVPAVVQ